MITNRNIGVYLRDLTLISDGNAKYLDENKTLINFDRMKLIADRVLEFNEIDASTYLQDIEFLPDLSSKLDQVSNIFKNPLKSDE